MDNITENTMKKYMGFTDLDQKYVLKDATEKPDGICLDSVNMGILIPTENDYQENDIMVIEEVEDNKILSDEIKIEYKQISSEVIMNETMLDESVSMIDDFEMKSENLPSNTNKCDEILPDINLEIDESSSEMDDTPSLANFETTPSQNDELLSQEYRASMILDSNDVESIQFDGVEMNSFSNVNDLDNADSSMLDEDALLNDDSSPMDDNAAINEISSQMDDENALLNEDGMDDGNAEQIDEDTLLNDEESILNESSSQKLNEVLSENDEDELLNERSSSQTNRKSTESEINLIETDEDTLLNEDSPQITQSQVNENIESSQSSTQIDENIESSQNSSQIDENIESSQNSSQIDENIESSQISSQIDENIESSQISSQIDESIESNRISSQINENIESSQISSQINKNIESSQISSQVDENIESSQISSQFNKNNESSQISLQINKNIESSQISSQVDENIESSQISSQVDENIESSETSSPVGVSASLNAAQSRDVESLLKDDCMLYIPVAESSQSITELLKDDGMLYIPEDESSQLIDEKLEEKKSKLSISSSHDLLSTPIKISLSNNYVNEHIGGEAMDSRESSEEGEIVTGDSLIISGESRFPVEPEIKQEHIEDCEQLTINEQVNFDDCEDNMNNEDMLDTGQKCNEVDGLFIKQECLERIGEESQDCNNVEMEDNTILPQIAICESLQNKQEIAVSNPTDTDIFKTVIKEECLEFDRIETLESNIKAEIADIIVKEECIDIFDQSLVKQEVGYFDDDLQHKEVDLSLNIVNDTDFSVVPVSLKSNSEFHNGNLPNSMEEEIIVPSSVTTNLRPRCCKKFRSKESDAISDKVNSEPHLQDMDEEVDDLLAPRGFACPICNKKYMSIVTLTRHEKTHEEIDLNDPKGVIIKDGSYSCTCGKGFRRRSSALACIKVHAKTRLPCQWCTSVFQTQMTLRKHCKVAHREMMRTRHHCTTCKKTFTHKRSLLKHTQLHLRDLKKEIKTKKNKARPKEIEIINLDSEDSLDKPQLSCDFCSIDYKSEADLRSHLICAHPVIHSASELDMAKRKPFSKFKFNCRTCGKGHSTLGALTLHNKTDHKKVKVTFSCDRCHERFPTRSELSSHRRLHCRGVAVLPPAPPPAPPALPPPPPAILPHQCDVCGLGFRSQGSMEQHRETHPFLTFARDDNTNTKIFFK